jgi:hypothetical protein
MSAEVLQEVTYDAEGRLISFIDFRPCTFITHYFDEAGHLIADGDAAEDEQADETNSSRRMYTYEAKDILAVEDEWAEVEQAGDDEQAEEDAQAETAEDEVHGEATETNDSGTETGAGKRGVRR